MKLVVLFVSVLCFIVLAKSQVPAPAGWTCDPAYYAEHANNVRLGKANCDCNCGVYDPDCDLDTDSTVEHIYCSPNRQDSRDKDRVTCQKNSLTCLVVPHDWTCQARWYNEGQTGTTGSFGSANPICHCGCGKYDPDCDLFTTPGGTIPVPLFCNPREANPQQSIGGQFNPGGGGATCSRTSATCRTVPEGWLCPTQWYHEASDGVENPSCHCGCGIYDPDCNLNPANKDIPLYCTAAVAGSPLSTDSTCQRKTATCTFVPPGWTCPRRWYAESLTLSKGADGTYDCDCGCGVYDPDCDLSPGFTPHPETGAVRGDPTAPPPASSVLNTAPIYCLNAKDEGPFFFGVQCSAKTDKCVDVPANWNCPVRWYNERNTEAPGPDGTVDCDCHCGAWDPDCETPDGESVAPLICSHDKSTSRRDKIERPSSDNQCVRREYTSLATDEIHRTFSAGICEASGASTLGFMFATLLLSVIASLVF